MTVSDRVSFVQKSWPSPCIHKLNIFKHCAQCIHVFKNKEF